MAYLSGATGFVKLGATAYPFGKWKVSMKAGTPKVTNWTTSGFQALVAGIISATLTASGAINNGSTAITVGQSYVFHLGMDTGVEVSFTAIVSALEPENDVEDAARFSITAESTGTFTAALT